MRTKGGSGDALDFGLETRKVRNLVFAAVGGHLHARYGFWEIRFLVETAANGVQQRETNALLIC